MANVSRGRRTEMYTLFTEIGGDNLLISAEDWLQVRMRLETAGPVAITTREQLQPLLSGRGVLLDDDDTTFVLNIGDRLFYTAQALNRVRVIIEPIPTVEVVPVGTPAPPPGPPAPGPEFQEAKTRLVRRKPIGKYPRWP